MTTSTTEEAAIIVQDFIALFFETFTEYKGRPFHISGESYGVRQLLIQCSRSLILVGSNPGRYIPVFAAQVLDYNNVAIAKGLTPINLQSVAIGNGVVNMMKMVPTLWDIACTSVSVEPFMSIAECVKMKRAVCSRSRIPLSYLIITQRALSFHFSFHSAKSECRRTVKTVTMLLHVQRRLPFAQQIFSPQSNNQVCSLAPLRLSQPRNEQ